MESTTLDETPSQWRPLAAALSTLGMGMPAPILPAPTLALGAGATSVGPLLTSIGLARVLVPLPAV